MPAIRPTRLRLLMVLVLAALLAGCTPKAPPPAQQVMDAVRAAQPFAEMTDMPKKQLASYLALEETWLTDAAAAFDVTRYTPEAVIILTAKDNTARDELRKALQTYRDTLLEEYRTYLPEEMPKIEQAVVREKGLQLALVISPDDQKTAQALDAVWK